MTDTTVRDTLKGLNEQQFRLAATTQEVQNIGGHVITDPTVRDTLKGLNEEQFPIFNGAPDMPHSILSVTDPTVRATLKGLNEEQFPVFNAAPEMPGLIQSVTDPTVRDTLKGLNEQQFRVGDTSPDVDNMGGYVLLDPTVRDTLKGLNEQQFRVGDTSPDVDNMSGYVLIDPTVRDTLKGLNEVQLQTAPASEEDTGSWVSFQGPLRIGARREQYATDTRPGPMLYAPDLSGPNIGPAAVTSRQNRGQDELYWVEPSQIVAEAGDSMTRWLGLQTRDTKREMGPSVPVANFTQDNGVFFTTDRMYPLTFPKCRRPDDLDDEFLTIRPDHFRQGTIFNN